VPAFPTFLKFPHCARHTKALPFGLQAPAGFHGPSGLPFPLNFSFFLTDQYFPSQRAGSAISFIFSNETELEMK
jgi:hypothetical protein